MKESHEFFLGEIFTVLLVQREKETLLLKRVSIISIRLSSSIIRFLLFRPKTERERRSVLFLLVLREDGGGGGMPTKILFGNKDNKFSTKEMKFVPNVKGYENVLDVIRIKDHLFIVRTASRPNFYEGAVIQQVSTKTMKTVSVHKNETMDWIRRIFKLKSDEKGFHYGSLSYHTKMLDFSFEDNELKLLYKIDEGQILEGLNKKTAAGSTIFSEDFEIEGKLAIRVDERNNKWYVKQDDNGNSIYCNKATDDWTHFKFGSADWSNYSISYRMKFLAGKGGQTQTHTR